jgi:hypothetical protein
LQKAQEQKDAMAAYRVVYETLGMSPEMVRAAFPPQTASRS